MSPGDTGGDSPGGSRLKNLGGRLSAQQGGCREGCFPCFTSGFGVCGLNPNVRLAFPGASWSPCDCINTGTVYNGNSHDLQCQKETFPLLTQAVPLHWGIVAIHLGRRLEDWRGDAMLHAGLPDHGSAASSCCLVRAKCHLV